MSQASQRLKAMCLLAVICLSTTPGLAAGGSRMPRREQAAKGRGQQCTPSLKSVADTYAARARTANATARLFEVSLQDLDADFFKTGKVGVAAEVESSFASAGDDVWYIKVRAPMADCGDGTIKSFQILKEGFDIKVCEQGYVTPDMKCLQPTGKPEPRAWHLPIRKWNVDLEQLRRIVLSRGSQSAVFSAVVITTVGRLKAGIAGDSPSSADTDPIAARVSHLPDDYAVISLAGRGGDGRTVEYLIIGAEKGEVIATGTYEINDKHLFSPP